MPDYAEAMLETRYLGGGKGPPRKMFIITQDAMLDLLEEWAETVKARATLEGPAGEVDDALAVAEDLYEFLEDKCEDFDDPAGDEEEGEDP